MKVIEEIQEWRSLRANLGDSVGFVPTMGALHPGHFALINRSKAENRVTVVSIFINPTQFNNTEDLQNYPSTMTQDLLQLASHEVDYVFCPSFDDIYPDNYRYKIKENSFSKKLCGASREGHFDGVLTVVMKLLNLVNPRNTYFGEKDYQQLSLIRDMVEAFFINTNIVAVKTIRDQDGLALSSRNQHLSSSGLKKAKRFAEILSQSPDLKTTIEELREEEIKVDYVEELQKRRYAAVYIDDVRLIDNVSI